jgi:hypothetical protein
MPKQGRRIIEGRKTEPLRGKLRAQLLWFLLALIPISCEVLPLTTLESILMLNQLVLLPPINWPLTTGASLLLVLFFEPELLPDKFDRISRPLASQKD